MSEHSFSLDDTVAILTRTPTTLHSLLSGLPERLLRADEGPGTWSPYEVVDHLIHGERTNWIPRTRHILAQTSTPFEPFDRTIPFTENPDASIDERLEQFTELRRANLTALQELNLTPDDLKLPGVHPELGAVHLQQLLAAWVTHDLNHIGQIVQTLAKINKQTVGPWSVYLLILEDRN